MQINYIIFHKKEILFQRPIKSYVNTSRQYRIYAEPSAVHKRPGSLQIVLAEASGGGDGCEPPKSFSGSKRWD